MDTLESWQDDPQSATNHLALGFNLDQRKRARQEKGRSSVPTWV